MRYKNLKRFVQALGHLTEPQFMVTNTWMLLLTRTLNRNDNSYQPPYHKKKTKKKSHMQFFSTNLCFSAFLPTHRSANFPSSIPLPLARTHHPRLICWAFQATKPTFEGPTIVWLLAAAWPPTPSKSMSLQSSYMKNPKTGLETIEQSPSHTTQSSQIKMESLELREKQILLQERLLAWKSTSTLLLYLFIYFTSSPVQWSTSAYKLAS